MDIVRRTRTFSEDCSFLEFSFDGFVYNPLEYAWDTHRQFLERFVKKGAKALFLGMNPGPFGMMQTGIPFGEINAVKDYLHIDGKIEKPAREHKARPVLGLNIERSEISGKRIWGLIQNHYPEGGFESDIAVFNYCPLGFLDSGKTAKNITPDKLLKEERQRLENLCDDYLSDIIEEIRPHYLVGVGKYALEKLKKADKDGKYEVFSIIHPSPGNPMANSGWAEKTEALLKEKKLWK